MSDSITYRRPSSHPLIGLPVVPIPAAATRGGLYDFLVYKPVQDSKAFKQHLMESTVGLKNASAPHKLAAQYIDADADLVADAPKDAAKLLDPATLVFSWIPEENTPA